MSTLLLFDHEPSEIEIFRIVTDSIGGLRDGVKFRVAHNIRELRETMHELSRISVCCVDFTFSGEQAISLVKEWSPDSMIVIIADENVSPISYIRPSIMAAGLLLRPLTYSRVNEVLTSVLFAACAKERVSVYGNEMFTINTRDGVIRIPYSELLYFEARNKKIAACTGRIEAEFYSTLDSLNEKLPNFFLRCHKSFIINTLMVERVNFASNIIFLANGFSVPLSRSFRSCVREALT